MPTKSVFSFKNSLVTLVIGACTLGLTSASAESRPDYGDRGHDHQSHNVNYDDYYDADQYSRAGPYRGSQQSYSRGYDNRRYDNRRGYDNYRGRNHRANYGRSNSRVVYRKNYSTKYRASITLVEEVYYTRSGREQLVCSIVTKGPEAYYIPKKRLRRIANRGCSKYARVQYL